MRLNALTPRERTVLFAVADGLSNAEIGAELGISPLTAKNHVTQLRQKFGAKSKAQVVALAYHHGVLISPIARPVRTRRPFPTNSTKPVTLKR